MKPSNSRLRYLAVGGYTFALILTTITNNLDVRDEATVLSTLATITGVIIALFFAIKQTTQMHKAQPWVMTWLMISLLVSLVSTIHALNIPADPLGAKILFVLSAAFFAGSTGFFVVKSGLLSEKLS